ncbi:Vta1 like-domain-containing protein [Collybia nuda]|uniref:Vta1 like-domain-containing protein n=1 Tax=Collybia nuda TaxID=64659 RepID=A0A9P6CRB2_9AGAR|nr:Vta1 like-domain-containing protein [Collybia nuda]
MSAQRLLGLPLITPELKSISPYLQRADELKSQDPIMAYWCAYYAAQVGIALKAKDVPSRDVLFALLGTLERLKKDIGPHDAVDVESASSAYVENFAFKVFTMADNEDRKGDPTRSTAKKFLAAANFLEVLKIFPRSEVAESNEDKIRYAKWKAADIAKAFREGRKPTPGPAGSGIPAPDLTPPASPPRPTNVRQTTPPRNLASGSPPSIARFSPPTHVDIPPRVVQPPQYSHPQTPPPLSYPGVDVQANSHLGVWAGEGETTPGSWSTVATPGTAPGPSNNYEQESPTRLRHIDHDIRGHKPRSGSGSSTGSNGSKGSNGAGTGGALKKPKAWVSEELDPQAENQFYVNGGSGLGSAGSSEGSKKSVHFTPSVVGGTSSIGETPPTSPLHDSDTGHTPSAFAPAPHSLETSGMSLPPGFISDPHQWTSNASPNTLMQPPPPPIPHMYSSPPPPPPVRIPPEPYQQPPSQHMYTPPPAFELTPSIIAKAQKHCRFAISALDYEDAEQARKELRAALSALGG